ncbi:hypothetical protein RCL_jg22631.t1 [Rhizophagus clarus]|uniref:Uncharacterized protein n=1 Tax=Rhizophagus clarus TaxID=94130 RepID=A0A8H3MJ02_9GLOM|nr:hypothetical protein RCL_jg22631.t1 [Rhizophagus clarus]
MYPFIPYHHLRYVFVEIQLILIRKVLITTRLDFGIEITRYLLPEVQDQGPREYDVTNNGDVQTMCSNLACTVQLIFQSYVKAYLNHVMKITDSYALSQKSFLFTYFTNKYELK